MPVATPACPVPVLWLGFALAERSPRCAMLVAAPPPAPPTGIRVGAQDARLSSREMRFYLTTPIYYVNSTPHIGHAYTTIAADIVVRHHRQRGDETYFLTGVDEHADKVARVAAEQGLDAARVHRPDRRRLAGAAAAGQRDQRLLHPDER